MFNQRNFFILFFAIVIGVTGYAFYFHSQEDEQEFIPQGGGLHIQSWKHNGAKVLYVHAPQLPMVDVRIVFDAGSARDADKPGLAMMTNLLLDHGAGNWNTNQIVERFDSVGAQFSTTALRDMAVVSLRSLTEQEWLETALQTMATILQKPNFVASELERERKRVLVGLKNQKESPRAQAELAFYEGVYGTHPYATPSSGTEQSIAAITREDVVNFYNKYYVASNATIVIVGAVDKDQARDIVDQLIDDMQEGKPAEVLPKVEPITTTNKIKKSFPSKQTHILVGHEGNVRGDKDYFAMYVGNHILGGSGFGSRIVEEIRESRGLAYSSYSYFSPMRNKGPFIMGLQTKNEQAEEALKVLMQTLNKFRTEGPSEKELISAKKNITGGFPLRIDSNKDITEYVAMIGFYDLPLDYLATFNDRIEEVSLADIKDVFTRRVHPDAMVIVMVGDHPRDSGALKPEVQPAETKQETKPSSATERSTSTEQEQQEVKTEQASEDSGSAKAESE
jgi:zinc protease